MIKSKNKIKVILTSYGSIETLELPFKLTKDSVNIYKLQVYVPITVQRTSSAIVKVWSTTINNEGKQIVSSEAYNIPYKENDFIKDFEYAVYEDNLPEEFLTIAGDLKLTFAYMDLNEDGELVALLPTQTLNTFVSGAGFNHAGVNVSNYDSTLARMNLLSELSVLKVDISKELPLGVVYNENGYKSPFYEYFNSMLGICHYFPISPTESEIKECRVVANPIVKDDERPGVIGYQTEYAFFDGGVCKRTNKYNISQGAIKNFTLLETGEWEIVNQQYISTINNQVNQSASDIVALYEYAHEGEKYHKQVVQNKKDIEVLYEYCNSGITSFGEYPTSENVPTDEQLNAKIMELANRAPQNGDEFTFVQIVENGTDRIYILKYSGPNQTWTKVRFPTIEVAQNDSLGLISGSKNEDFSEETKVLVDIKKGKIKDIESINEIKEKESMSTHLNRNSADIDKLESALEKEVVRASDKEDEIVNTIAVEKTRAENAENALMESFQLEKNRAEQREQLIIESINIEEDRAISSENDIIRNLQTEESRALSVEQNLDEKINQEKSRALNAENGLENKKLDKSSVDENYTKNTIYSMNGDSVVANIEFKNPKTGATENLEVTIALPASSQNTGLMTSEMVVALSRAIKDIESLKYVGVQVASFQTYADAELFDFGSLIGVNNNDYFIVNEDESRVENTEHLKTTRYVCIDNTQPLSLNSFRFSNVVTTVNIQVASETSLGGIISTNTNGYVYVEDNGAAKLVGYDGILTSINNLMSSLSSEISRATKVESDVNTALTQEVNRATSAEKVISDNIADEIERAKQAEQVNAAEIAKKVNQTIKIAGQPLIADVSLKKLTIKRNDISVAEYDGATEKEINISTAVKTSELTNDGDGIKVNNAVDPYAKVSQIPINNNQLTNGANYATKTDVSNGYVAKVTGKGLSTNDFTTTEKNKLASLNNYDDSTLVAKISKNTTDITNLSNIKADKEKIVYDLVIRTQEEFEQMINSSDWLGAKSVALIGKGSAFDASGLTNGITIPNNVYIIHCFNDAAIRCIGLQYTNLNEFVKNKCNISDLTLYVIDNYFGFRNCANLINCVAIQSSLMSSTYNYCFTKCINLINCIVEDNRTSGWGVNLGFKECENLVNCSTNSQGVEISFNNCNNLVNCSCKGKTETLGDEFFQSRNIKNCHGSNGKSALEFSLLYSTLLTNGLTSGTATLSESMLNYNFLLVGGINNSSGTVTNLIPVQVFKTYLPNVDNKPTWAACNASISTEGRRMFLNYVDDTHIEIDYSQNMGLKFVYGLNL